MDTHPALLLPSWSAALETVWLTTSARLDALVGDFLDAPQQPRRDPAPDSAALPATRESFREFTGTRSHWAQRAFACLLHGTRTSRGRESLHVEVAWAREDARLAVDDRETETNELIELVQGLDAVLVMQVGTDVDQALAMVGGRPGERVRERLESELLSLYRWRHLGRGFHRRGFALLLRGLLPPAARARLESELAPIVGAPRSTP